MTDPHATGLATRYGTDASVDTMRWGHQINNRQAVTCLPDMPDANDFFEYWCEWANVRSVSCAEAAPLSSLTLASTNLAQRWVWEQTVLTQHPEVATAARQWYRDKWFGVNTPVNVARKFAQQLQEKEMAAPLAGGEGKRETKVAIESPTTKPTPAAIKPVAVDPDMMRALRAGIGLPAEVGASYAAAAAGHVRI